MRMRISPPGWLRRTAGLVAISLTLATVGVAAAQTGPADPTAVKHFTKDPVFHLPIKIEDKARSTIQQVQLYVKSPGGGWERKEVAAPSQKVFTFKAPVDGEYWFTLVTIDNKGVPSPPDLNRLPPEDIVMVVVDTTAPVFDLQPLKTANGDLLLRCIVSDANPDYRAVKIAYRGADMGMHFLEPVGNQPGFFRVPNLEIFANPVRVVVTDLALNTTTRDVPLQDTVAKLWPSAAQIPVVSGDPTVSPGSGNLQPAGGASASSKSSMAQVGGSLPASIPSVEAHSQQAVAPGAGFLGAIPRQILNTTRVSLDYRIDQIGPSGVGKVEVWMTTDGGAAWKRLCEDMDRRTPVEFDLPGDGVYGVRMALTNGNGFGGHAPAAGEQPQMWIEVDTIAPVVQLKEVEPNPAGGTIDIRWMVSDKNLGTEPINLYFATHREGPWKSMARNLKNDGLYHWPIPQDVGEQFFVRVEAVDAAGNVARSDTPSAIVVDMTEPRASVVGVTGIAK